ncbi:MAG: fibronectin type III domain-containing protein, partial [Patescibacteria group bacterium]
FTPPVNNGGSVITSYTVTSNVGGFTATGGSSPITITGLTNGTTYTFTVTATNEIGTSTLSGTSNSVIPATTPNAPTGVSAVSGNGEATITFTPPVYDGGSVITSYTVTSNAGHTATGGSSPITITGLTNGTTYTFTVTATNAIGVGPSSTGASNSATPATVPDAPTNLAATIGDGSASLSWSAPADNGGAAITIYTVTSNVGGFVATSSSPFLTVNGLTNGTTYTFTVTATNAVGTSTPSGTSNSITPASAPNAPTNLAVIIQNSSVDLSWSAPVFNGGSPITDYVVEYKLTSGGVWSVFNDGIGTTPATTVTSLSNDNSYDFRVSAKNIVGRGTASTEVSGTPGSPAQVLIQSFSDLTLPSIATAIRITNDSSTAYEYQYNWCVTNSDTNLCGGGDDIFSSTAAILINPHANFDTTLNSIVSAAGNYWFHLNVQFGSDSSRAMQSFTVVSETVVTPPSGGGGGGGGGAAPVLPPVVEVPETTCIGADFNHDGKVNSVDFSIMLAFWKTTAPFKNVCVDINSDKQVNSVDFSILLYQWGKAPIKLKQ